MEKREIEYVLEICQEVDLLVSKDPGAASMEVLERFRLMMNDLLWRRKWREAEGIAYRLLLLREGLPDEVGRTMKTDA